MNSYINLILDAEGAKERLRRLFQSAPESQKDDRPLPLVFFLKQRQRRKRSARSKTLSTSESHGYCGVGLSLTVQSQL